MISIVEQRYLLEMLKSERTRRRFTSGEWNSVRTTQFYRVMNLLKHNELVNIMNVRNSNRKIYRLTVFGMAVASIIAKHTKSEDYKQYAFDVEMMLL